MDNPADRSPPPDGVDREQIEPHRGVRRHTSILSLVVLGAVCAGGLSGYLGQKQIGLVIDNSAGRFEIDAPAIARNGNIIETRIHVLARKPVDTLVIGIEPGLWRGITTNATAPTPGGERFADGLWRFSFDQLAAGAEFEFQFDQQINPDLIGTNRGRIIFFDGTVPLAQATVTLTVLP